jgi:hypothetical protein
LKKFHTFLRIAVILLITAFVIEFSGSLSINSGYSIPVSNSSNNIRNGNIVSQMIKNIKINSTLRNLSLFNLAAHGNAALEQYVINPVFLKLNYKNLKNLLSAYEELELARVNILSKDFQLSATGNKGKDKLNYKAGVYYRGIIKGDDNSVAAISIFDDFLMGVISSRDGNLVLGPVDKKLVNKTDYILYNDRNLKIKNGFKCGVGDNEDSFVRNTKTLNSGIENQNPDRLSKDTISVFYVADYQMYLDRGNNTANFITGIFNNVAALYQNESIPVNISGIYVYRNEDPYANDTDSYQILLDFGYNTQDDFMGDLAQLLSTAHEQALGGIAYINVLCTPYNSSDYSGRYSFCNIDNSYLPIPTYSWTVTVMTHELGHNLGSYHTHACHWPVLPYNGIGAIDSCYYAEGNCFYGYQGNFNGTIMSYCHLTGAINLSLGFGPLPGDTIRSWYALATCIHSNLNSSEVPTDYNLLQNYPNPFNPTTNVRFALPEDGFVTMSVYDLTGREVVKLLNNQFYTKGIYGYTIDANLYKMASGVYFYKIQVNHENKNVYSEVKKMVLIK